MPLGAREEQVEYILDNLRPSRVGIGFRDAAVLLVPTFAELVVELERDEADGDIGDAVVWLEENATRAQLDYIFRDSVHAKAGEVFTLVVLQDLWGKAQLECSPKPSDMLRVRKETEEYDVLLQWPR